MIRRLAISLLELAEFVYLKAHGWNRVSKLWVPPVGYPFKRPIYNSRRHAVNAQRQLTYNPAYGGSRQELESNYQGRE